MFAPLGGVGGAEDANRQLNLLLTDNDRKQLQAKAVVLESTSPADAIVDYAKETPARSGQRVDEDLNEGHIADLGTDIPFARGIGQARVDSYCQHRDLSGVDPTMTIRISGLALGLLLLAGGVASAQTPRTGGLMREKLGHAQKLLEALTTSNQTLLARETEALSRIAASPRWAELRTPELRGYTDTFLKAVADMDAAAKRRDLDAAAVSYSALTTACYQCHKHLKDTRIAR